MAVEEGKFGGRRVGRGNLLLGVSNAPISQKSC